MEPSVAIKKGFEIAVTYSIFWNLILLTQLLLPDTCNTILASTYIQPILVTSYLNHNNNDDGNNHQGDHDHKDNDNNNNTNNNQ